METELTHKELLRQLSYNALTGILRWKVAKGGSNIGDIAGSKRLDGYIEIGINSKLYKAHLLAWFYYYGHWPENEIDHKNRKGWCNWILNLREASRSCQMRNTGIRKDNTSGVKGVNWSTTEGWVAQIQVNKKKKYLGGYKDDFDEAVCARLATEQCVNWTGCDSTSSAYLYVKGNIQ